MTDVSGYFIFNDLVGSGTSTGGATDLSALTDTSIGAPTNTQVLSYVSSTGLWTNTAQTGGGGGVSVHADLTNLGLPADDHEQYVFTRPTTSERNQIIIQNASYQGLSIKAHASQAVPLQTWTNSDGLTKTSVLSDGSLSGIEATFGDLSGLNSVSSLSINGGTVNSTGDLNVTGNISVTGTVTGATEVSSTICKADDGLFTNLSSTSDFNVTGSTTLGNVTGTNINCTNLSATNDVSAGGNILLVGTVDGVDIATANTKLNDHVASGSVHYIQTDIDHGNLQGLLDDDHTIYILDDGTRSIDHLTVDNDLFVVGDITVTGTVDGIDLPARDTVLTNHVASATVHFVQGDIDHAVLQNLTTGNPHTQYVLKTGGTPFTGDATFDAGINVSGSIAINGTVDGVDVAARDTVLTNHVASSVHQVFTTTTAGIVPECDSSQAYKFINSTGAWEISFPYSYVQMDGAGFDSASPYYFASGVTATILEKDTDQIEWDDTNKYFAIKETGTYEMVFCGAVTVASSPTEIAMTVVKSAAPASDLPYLEKIQTIRTNMDPHDLNIRWVGYIAPVSTDNYTLRIDGTNACQLKEGSTLTMKRIG
jgi:hypothetical protein